MDTVKKKPSPENSNGGAVPGNDAGCNPVSG
jgi:hypothetical protein